MPLRATALVTVAQAKAYSGIETATTTWDTVLETLIDGVSEGFNRACDRVLAKATHTDVYLDGPEGRGLILPDFPVISITSVYEDDVLLTVEVDYRLYAEAGILRRIGGDWARGDKIIKITYVAGYVVLGGTPAAGETALPGDLQLAALRQIAAEWMAHKNKTWGRASESGPDGSSITRFETTQFVKGVPEVLVWYKRI